MTYRTLGRIIKEVVGGTSQPKDYSNLDTSIKAVIKGSVKKIEKDNLNLEPAEYADDIKKELDNEKDIVRKQSSGKQFEFQPITLPTSDGN